MKMHFVMVVKGKSSLKEKLESAIQNNPDLHKQMIHDFCLSIVKRLEVNEQDGMTVEKFRAAEISQEE